MGGRYRDSFFFVLVFLLILYLRPKRLVAFSKAKRLLGIKEYPGSVHNQKILKFFREIGQPGLTTDETSWCAAFVNYILKRSGAKYIKSALARDLLKLPGAVSTPKPGDVLIFWRTSPSSIYGHTGFYAGQTGSYYKVLGGNQTDSVSYLNVPKNRLLGIRRPKRR
ncbi:MAG: TIGR02594 family protein [Bacteroidetes bacterium]|nr:TIGR02594 family protein [Bacteroidota bacterium]